MSAIASSKTGNARTNGDTKHQRHADRDKRDGQRNARPIEDTAEEIAPELVGPHQMLAARFGQALRHLHRARIVWSDDRRHQRAEDDEQHDRAAEHCRRRTADPPPAATRRVSRDHN
jgi:hypothetical protein